MPSTVDRAIPMAMRFLIAAALLFMVAACARVPTETATPAPPPAPPVQQPRESGVLIGLTGPELAGRFGRPVLQIKEGNSFKLQFRSRQCVLDAFLYPSTGGQHRVTHVETRSLAGADVNQSTCIAALTSPG